MGFLIEFNDPLDAYAFQLYDITGRSPEDVYTDTTLFVLGNWSTNNLGLVGTKERANLLFGCALPNVSAYNYMPDILEGHDYLLLVNHIAPGPQGGYKITMRGGTADISDPKVPILEKAQTSCAATLVRVKISKKILCSSISPDGSDFKITDPSVSIIAASGSNSCNDGFETDTVTLTLGRGLPQGNYNLLIKNGTDNNTLLSSCLVPVAANSGISFNLAGDTKAAFTASNFVCPGDAVVFANASEGNIVSWDWDFKNGQTSTEQLPPAQTYPPVSADRELDVRLAIRDADNCTDTAYRRVKLIYNCYIAVPSAFTPNGDGINDFLYPVNAYKATDLTFRVFDRRGQLLFQTKDWTRKWDGTFRGDKQPVGTYVWLLDYTDDRGIKISKKGTTVLIR